MLAIFLKVQDFVDMDKGDINLDFIKLKKQMNKLENELKKDSPKYEFLKTKPGKIFQDNFVELMGIVNLSNFSAAISPIILRIIKSFDKSWNDFTPDFKDKALKKENLSESELTDSLDLFIEKFLTIDSDKNLDEIISKILNIINSYYFLALYAYIDLYSMSLYKFIISQLEEDELYETVIGFNAMENPSKRIWSIKKTLNVIDDEKFDELRNGRTWKESFEMLIELRNFIAHRDPKLRISLLEERFPRALKSKAKKQIKKVFNHQAFIQLDNQVLSKIKEITESYLLTLFLLKEIGKECYGYLALIDNLIDNKF